LHLYWATHLVLDMESELGGAPRCHALQEDPKMYHQEAVQVFVVRMVQWIYRASMLCIADTLILFDHREDRMASHVIRTLLVCLYSVPSLDDLVLFGTHSFQLLVFCPADSAREFHLASWTSVRYRADPGRTSCPGTRAEPLNLPQYEHWNSIKQ
uniref:Pecanex-like protein n=1 Tax=Haemonchus placei TaxID=6290 RepID=A0A0N4X2X3_HAEPC